LLLSQRPEADTARILERDVEPTKIINTPQRRATHRLDSAASAVAKSATLKPASERDYRLDFCRGIALIIIFIDHVPGNPLSNWTLKRFAFCDAAEIFVLISGISSYLAYGSKLDRDGILGLSTTIGRRWLKIYSAHLLLLLGVATALLTASWYFARPEYLDFLRMRWLFDEPREAIAAAVTLRYLPNYLDILPLYLVLLGAAPGIIWLVKRDVRLALGVSILIYVAAQWTGFNFPAGDNGEVWNFNPFAWQLLYTVGIAIGHRSKTRRVSAPDRARSLAVAGAIAFVGFAFVMAAPWRGTDIGLTFFNPNLYLWPADKTMLAPLRVVNILALMYVVAHFISPQAGWLKTRFAAPLLSCGRHSLPVFGVGVLLSSIGYIAVNETGGALNIHTAVNLLGVFALFILGGALDWRRSARAEARVQPQAIPAFARRAA
jgi:hypothetical protein